VTSHDLERRDLVRRFVDERTVALLLVGSYARGDHEPLSDVDLARHVDGEDGHGELVCAVDEVGRLITVKSLDIAREERALSEPREAVWQVPTLRDAVILYDGDGRAARMVDKARAFSWAALGDAPDRHVAREVAAYAEEALKIAGGLAAGRAGQVLYGTFGMVVGLAEAMAVHRRVFITSENRLFDLALGTMADCPGWTTAFRTAAGFEAVEPEGRGRAALALFEQTVALISPLLDTEQRAVTDTAVAAVGRAGI
jgi:predicted nucleotidyltransferase